MRNTHWLVKLIAYSFVLGTGFLFKGMVWFATLYVWGVTGSINKFGFLLWLFGGVFWVIGAYNEIFNNPIKIKTNPINQYKRRARI